MNAQKDPELDWASLRTAFHVARLGTLTAAASYLGVHHATVIRHIDALESQLHCKLFQRQARGYTPTEAGQTLFNVVSSADEQFAAVAKKLRGQSGTVSGNLTITSVPPLSNWITPLIAEFQKQYPDIRISLDLDDRLLRLDLGEAHIALRTGPKPAEPDNIVRALGKLQVALFAHQDYIDAYGDIDFTQGFKQHRFVGASGVLVNTPVYRWLAATVDADNIVFKASDLHSLENAVRSGAGVGFLPVRTDYDSRLIMVKAPEPDWAMDIWLVTHRDINRMAKVSTLAQFLVERMKASFS